MTNSRWPRIQSVNRVFALTLTVQFLHSGADGIPLAQAFRFIDMDDVSSERFSAAARQMERAGFSDVEANENPLGNLASQTLSKLRDSIRRLSMVLAPGETNES